MYGFYLFRILKVTIGVCAFFVISFFIFAHAASAAGIWISQAELAAKPMSGSAWNGLLSAANSSCGTPDLANQDDGANVCVMAKALVFARTGTTSYRTDVITALRSIVNSGTYNGRALAIGRELGAYVIAADLISLSTADSALDQQFRLKIREFLTTPTSGGPPSLIDCHEDRPNNWGAHCGASRAAVYAYLGDAAGIARVAQVFKGWLGDQSSYTGFSYGDLSWQCNASAPVGVNPPGCVKDGHNINGVLPDDQRRCGSFGWPPCQTGYNWEALQGVLAQAIILQRQGYDPQNWSSQALKRAVTWLYNVSGDIPSSDDTWAPWVVNYFYGTSFSTQSPSNPGKNVGWTDWTHSGTASATPPPSPTPTPTPTPPPSPTLSVTLTVNPSSGVAPLSGVDLTADVGGTATGAINYTFYCSRTDTGTNITSGWVAKYDGVTTDPRTAVDVCTYGSAGTFATKVVVERGLVAAEARTTVTVTAPSSPPPTPLSGPSIYISQSAAGSGDGSSCTNARAASYFNSASNWGSGTTQIGPGKTVRLCGTVTTGLATQGSGAAGNPITVDGTGATAGSGWTITKNFITIQNVRWPNGGGVFIGGGSMPHDIVIRNSYFKNQCTTAGGDVIGTEGSYNVVIEGNYMENCAASEANHDDLIQTWAAGGNASLAPHDWTIRYNYFVMNTTQSYNKSYHMLEGLTGPVNIYGNVYFGLRGAGGANGVNMNSNQSGMVAKIYGNTMVQKSGGPNNLFNLKGSGNWDLKNNVIYSTDAGNTLLGDAVGTSRMTRSNNLWFGSGSPSCVTTEKCGQNPLFTNLSANDFSLQSGSPARNAGANLGLPYNQYISGATWPGPTLGTRPSSGAWDMGAYQASGGTTPPPSPTPTPPPPTPTPTPTPSPSPSDKFTIGQQVQANNGVNVRQTPAGTLLGTQASGAVGTVTAGPTSAVLNGTTYVWWTINFSSGVDGWVGEDKLNPYTSPAPTPTIVTGDFNGDGLVNSIDLSLMTTYWNQNNATYDLNHDGIVNSLDYVIMVQNWSA